MRNLTKTLTLLAMTLLLSLAIGGTVFADCPFIGGRHYKSALDKSVGSEYVVSSDSCNFHYDCEKIKYGRDVTYSCPDCSFGDTVTEYNTSHIHSHSNDSHDTIGRTSTSKTCSEHSNCTISTITITMEDVCGCGYTIRRYTRTQTVHSNPYNVPLLNLEELK